jgi:hypothetical protein
MEVIRAHRGVMCPRVIFNLVVCQIFLPGVPNLGIHILGHFICNPKIPHFYCPQLLTFDGIIGNTDGGRIVAVDGGFGLRVTKIFEGKPIYHPFLTIQK